MEDTRTTRPRDTGLYQRFARRQVTVVVLTLIIAGLLASYAWWSRNLAAVPGGLAGLAAFHLASLGAGLWIAWRVAFHHRPAASEDLAERILITPTHLAMLGPLFAMASLVAGLFVLTQGTLWQSFQMVVAGLIGGVPATMCGILASERVSAHFAQRLAADLLSTHLQRLGRVGLSLRAKIIGFPVAMQAVTIVLFVSPGDDSLAGAGVASAISIILMTLIACLLTLNVSMILDSLVQVVTGTSEGDLRPRLPVVSADELGQLAARLNRMLDNLSSVFRQVRRVANQVGEVTANLVVVARKLSDGVELQAESTSNTSASIEQIRDSIDQVAANVEQLFREAEISSSSTLEMTLSIEEVAANIESLSASVDATSSSIEQMTATVRAVADSASDLATSSQEVATAIGEIDAGLHRVQEDAKRSTHLSETVLADAERGAASVAATIEGMQTIRDVVFSSASVVARLGERSEEIGKILGVIDNVASQTNLLALNAEIIAAQAGEQGRGFAVVAQEIRDLAVRTAASTREISDLIEAVQREAAQAVAGMERGSELVEKGVTLSQRAGQALEAITHSATESSNMTHTIAENTVVQTRHAREVSTAVDNFRALARQIAKATSEQSIGIDQIMRESENIRDMADHVRRATVQQAQGSKQIAKTVDRVSEMTEGIVKATQQQKSSARQIVDAIDAFQQITLKNLDTGVEIDRAVQELSREAKALEEQLDSFSI